MSKGGVGAGRDNVGHILSIYNCSDDYAVLISQNILLPVLTLDYSNSGPYLKEGVTEFTQLPPNGKKLLSAIVQYE